MCAEVVVVLYCVRLREVTKVYESNVGAGPIQA